MWQTFAKIEASLAKLDAEVEKLTSRVDRLYECFSNDRNYKCILNGGHAWHNYTWSEEFDRYLTKEEGGRLFCPNCKLSKYGQSQK